MQLSLMDSFVAEKLTEWQLDTLIDTFKGKFIFIETQLVKDRKKNLLFSYF